MQVLGRCFGVLGILSLVYYIIITVYAGFRVSYGWLWLLAGAAGFALFALFGKMSEMTALHWIILVFLCLLLLLFLITEAWIIAGGRKKPQKGADAVIVLGAQVKGTRITRALRLRLEGALEYSGKNPDVLIVVSGGQGTGEDISEALAMKNYLLEHGVEENRILVEDKSTNTRENLAFSGEIIKEREKTEDLSDYKVIVITNCFHAGRALLTARRYGFKKAESMGVPSGSVLVLHYYVREALAVWKEVIKGR